MHIRQTLAPQEKVILSELPDAEGCKQLREDMSLLTEILCELLDCPEVGLRCTQVEHAMCPRLHVDRVPLRLLCTYEGPGTEWLEDQGVARNDLSNPDIAKGACQRAATGDVVLLKGALWQDNEGFGAIHRSPALDPDEGRRTLVTMDPLW